MEKPGVGYTIEKFTISRDDSLYECFPSLARCNNGRIILTYRESDSHVARDFCRLVVRISDDNGKTFSERKILAESHQKDGVLLKYNCPKVQQLKDGRILLICDVFKTPPADDEKGGAGSDIVFFFSNDCGETWSAEQKTGVHGIMPDEVIELANGDWLLATQFRRGNTFQCVSRSTDGGKTWSEPITIAAREGFNFCEASILQLPTGELVCYMRENSGKGLPIYKSISKDGGKTWEGPFETLMMAGHRPVAHLTKSGKVMITYRHQPGGAGAWAKNTFAYLESVESALETDRSKQFGVILPLDHDRSQKSDGGYTGWVEIEQGCFFAVNYIVDDAPKAQIRGYRFREQDF
ncbi:MAG: glycoside hydrolase [Armatimonadetes bacterium]|nr:glycoside hydrolase [Armatimonadota bacterium]